MTDHAARGLMILGTDTEIGKTYVTLGLIRQLRESGHKALAMKPVACGMEHLDGRWQNEDVELLCPPVENALDRALCNPYIFRPFCSPHLAAEQAGQPISLDRIAEAYDTLAGQADWVVVESAGGLMTPLSEQEDFVDLTKRLDLPALLVVGIRLGCINHARLTVRVLQAAGLRLAGWVANYAKEGVPEPEMEAALKQLLPAPCLGVIGYKKTVQLDLSQCQ